MAELRDRLPDSVLRVLFVGERQVDARRIATALRRGNQPVVVFHALDLSEAARIVAARQVHAVLVDFRVLASLTGDIRRKLAPNAFRAPVIVLLDDDDVVDIKKAIEARAEGFFYERQLSPVLIQRTLRMAV